MRTHSIGCSFVLALVLCPSAARAQLPLHALDASFGASNSTSRFSLTGLHRVSVAQGSAWVGIGLRATAYTAKTADFTNRGTVQGVLVATTPIAAAVYGLNLMLEGDIRVTGSVSVGANLDIVGVAAGPTRSLGSVSAKPTGVSLFEYGSNDRGSLNSEFYVAVALNSAVRLRLGASHYVLGYDVTDQVSAGPGIPASSRYQRFATVPFVAISIPLFGHERR